MDWRGVPGESISAQLEVYSKEPRTIGALGLVFIKLCSRLNHRVLGGVDLAGTYTWLPTNVRSLHPPAKYCNKPQGHAVV
jgi:hypothetical protein